MSTKYICDVKAATMIAQVLTGRSDWETGLVEVSAGSIGRANRRDMEGSAIRPHGQLLTVSEVAALLQLSVNTIYYLVNRREIPFLKAGRRLRFSKEEVIEFFKARSERRQPPCRILPVNVKPATSSLKTRRAGRVVLSEKGK